MNVNIASTFGVYTYDPGRGVAACTGSILERAWTDTAFWDEVLKPSDELVIENMRREGWRRGIEQSSEETLLGPRQCAKHARRDKVLGAGSVRHAQGAQGRTS